MKIWILDPYHAGSHRDWSCGVQQVLEMAGHQVTMHTMPGRHWKWRMHAAAAHFASLMGGSEVPDVVVTTDMCDVAQLRGLMPVNWNNVRVATMFHENQFYVLLVYWVESSLRSSRTFLLNVFQQE